MFIKQLQHGLNDCGLTDPNKSQRILIAVSGGADSVALLLGCSRIAGETGNQLGKFGLEIHAAHLDHGLRTDSADDAAWVAQFCRKLSVPLISERQPIAIEPGSGIEESARTVRYDFLSRAAKKAGCRFIVTAHHADDQVETILHNLLRGTGVAGLRGMRAERPLDSEMTLARPMLSIERSTIDQFLHTENQTFRQDATNDDCSMTRNRIRNQLLPLLEKDYNPAIRTGLLRLGQQAAGMESTLNRLADEALNEALLEESEMICRLDRRGLVGLPDHLLRHCFVRLWTRLKWPRQKMGFKEWSTLADRVRDPADVDLPRGIRVTCRNELLVIERNHD